MLELRDVTLSLGEKRLIANFNLAIAPGHIVTLMGASGSGKSSLLSFIAGDLPEAFSSTGQIILNGISQNNVLPEKRRIGRLFQDDLIFPHMSVGENLLFAISQGTRVERLEKMRSALKHAELEGFETRAPHTLSGGQRSRVSLMRSLLAQPAAILLDEPFNKLDQELRASIRQYTFNQISQRAIPCLLVTHDTNDAPQGSTILHINKDGLVHHV